MDNTRFAHNEHFSTAVNSKYASWGRIENLIRIRGAGTRKRLHRNRYPRLAAPFPCSVGQDLLYLYSSFYTCYFSVLVQSAAMKLYVDMLSQPSRAVCLFCELNDITYEKVLVRLAKGEHRAKWFAGTMCAQRVTC